MGGYLSSLYASLNKDRILALFCVSAAGVETYDPANYHPERYADFDEPTRYLNPKVVKAALKMHEEKRHPFAVLERMGPENAATILEGNIRKQILRDDNPSTEA